MALARHKREMDAQDAAASLMTPRAAPHPIPSGSTAAAHSSPALGAASASPPRQRSPSPARMSRWSPGRRARSRRLLPRSWPRAASAEALVLDVADPVAVQRTLGEREPFDILVNNAGTNRPAPFTEVTVEDFDAVLGLNLRAAFFVAQAVARRLIAAGKPGSIIHISSQMGHVGGARRSVYCASKHAIEGLTKAMAIDLAPHRHPRKLDLPDLHRDADDEALLRGAGFRADVLGKIKLGRLGQVEDLMGTIVLLAGDASALTTGSSLIVDGGWTAE